MAQIGSFSRDKSGVFTGSIRTLTLNVKATIRPVDRDNDKAPTPASLPARSRSAPAGPRPRARPAPNI